MMIKLRIIILVFINFISAYGQVEDAWVYFKDKPLMTSYLNNPEKMLSPKTIARREKYNLKIDVLDVPVDQAYYSAIFDSDGISILAQSKWMNSVYVRGEVALIADLAQLQFVDKIVYANKSREDITIIVKKNKVVQREFVVESDNSQVYSYGASENQIQMLGGTILHQNNFTGKGITIAVLDAGFQGVDTALSFGHLYDNQQIKGGYNFVNRSDNYYTSHDHGTMVLSCMAAHAEGQLVGGAPDAEFYLFITEDVNNESPLEEALWVEAAEYSDSLGVDIINTSLGYSKFDNPTYDYTYEDMDGKTSFIAAGLAIADKKGILCVVSAGNEGQANWQYISTPADSDYALTVGAVNPDKSYAVFSSIGPTSDGRLKPDVTAQGADVVVVNKEGIIQKADGTSFSSPIISGMAACLWQMYPEKSNTEIKEMIVKSSHLYGISDYKLGNGIPDFSNILFSKLGIDSATDTFDFTNNNPVDSILRIKSCDNVSDEMLLEVYDLSGRLIINKNIKNTLTEVEFSQFPSGMYLLKITKSKDFVVNKFVKN